MRLQSERSAGFNDFTDMMHQLLKAAWGNDWGTFTEDYPNGRDPKNITMPMITYAVTTKVPATVGSGTTREIKPRYRQTLQTDDKIDGMETLMNVYAQTFDHTVEFEMWAENNTDLNELCERFEEFMMIYSGYFLQNGVQQILFVEMAPPFQVPRMDDKAVTRVYKYLVRLEKQVVVPTAVITEVIGKVRLTPQLTSDPDQIKEAIDFRSK